MQRLDKHTEGSSYPAMAATSNRLRLPSAFRSRMATYWLVPLLLGLCIWPATVFSQAPIQPCTNLNTDGVLELELAQLLMPDPLAPPVAELAHPVQMPLPGRCLAVDAAIESGFLTALGLTNPTPDIDIYTLSLTSTIFWLSLSHSPANLYTVTITDPLTGQAFATCTGRLNECQVQTNLASVNIVISARDPGVYILSIYNEIF